MRAIISGGGTGGHIYPAESITKLLIKNYNAKCYYIGSKNGLEQRILDRNLFEEVKFFNSKGLNRKNLFKAIISLINMFFSTIQVYFYFLKVKPNVAIATGGYASMPTVYAAKLTKTKLIIHEQNSTPGLTTKKGAKFASKIMVSFKDSNKYFQSNNVVFSGNPRYDELKKENLKNPINKTKQILIYSGSRGALHFNNQIKDLYKEFAKLDYNFIHITGVDFYKENTDYKNIKVLSYENQIENLIANSDLVICRSGATTIAELMALQKPSILVPSPYVTDDHQTKNAMTLVKINGAVIVKEKEISTKLLKAINNLDSQKIKTMQDNIKKITHPDFEKILIEVINE